MMTSRRKAPLRDRQAGGDAHEDIAKAVHTLERLLETIDERDEKGGETCNDSKT